MRQHDCARYNADMRPSTPSSPIALAARRAAAVTVVARRGPRRPQRLAQDSLAFALLGAARVCLAVREGRSLTEALVQASAAFTPAERGALADLCYRTMRRRGLADALINRLTAERVLEPPLLREVLAVALTLLDAALPMRRKVRSVPTRGRMEPDSAGDRELSAEAVSSAEDVSRYIPYPPHTVVDQAVDAASSQPELARGSGLVNAVLRNFLRDPNVHRAMVMELDVQAAYNYPEWWVNRVRQTYPGIWERMLRVSDSQPPMTLRVNLSRTHPDAALALLAGAGMAARRIGGAALRLDRPCPVERLPGFAEGLVSVQDEAAQRAAPLLDLDDGLRVLDACAAPGGKAAHILEIADVELIALDISGTRLKRVRDNFERLGTYHPPRVQLLEGDAARPADWWDGRLFDRILADVPCTASGVVRRNPDIRWLRRETDIDALAIRQQAILEALWPLLAPGGKLLYVTCSVFPEESISQATSFVERHPDARLLPAPGQLLPEAEGEFDHDGLYFALIGKAA